MRSIRETRVIDVEALAELQTNTVSVMYRAEEISRGHESVLSRLEGLYAQTPPEYRVGSLDEKVSELSGTLVKEEYGETAERTAALCARLSEQIPAMDAYTAKRQEWNRDRVGECARRIRALTELVDGGVMELPYIAFQFRLNVAAAGSGTEGVNYHADSVRFLGRCPDCIEAGDPVNTVTGNFVYDREDLRIPGRTPLAVVRFYNALDASKGVLGRGWRHNYENRILFSPEGGRVELGDGKKLAFLNGDGQVKAEEGGFLFHREGTDFHFDARGLCVYQKQPEGNVSFQYDDAGRLLRAGTGRGEALYYFYGSKGRLERVEDHTGRSVSYTCEEGRLSRAEDSCGGCVRYGYGDSNRLETVTDETGRETVRNVYDEHRRIIKQSFGSGRSLQLVYGQGKTVTVTEDGAVTEYLWDEAGRTAAVLRGEGEDAERHTYDAEGRRTSFRDREGRVITCRYDEEGRLCERSCGDRGSEKIYYDTEGRAAAVKRRDGSVLWESFDRQGRVAFRSDGYGRTLSFSYDSEGRICSLVHGGGAADRFTYDERGNILRVEFADGTGSVSGYDDLNRVTRRSDTAGNRAEYAYDDRNRPVRSRINGEEIFYTYRADGLLSEKRTASGRVLRYEYDGEDRPERITDGNGKSRRFFYDREGRLQKEQDRNGRVITYRHDRTGRLAEVTEGADAAEGEGCTVRYVHDAAGALQAVCCPDGRREENRLPGYLPAEYTAKKRVKLPGEGYLTEEKDRYGRVIGRTWPGGIRAAFTYDAQGYPASLCYLDAQGELDRFAYRYDGEGNLTGKEAYRRGMPEESGSYAYHYDACGRLAEVEKDGERLRAYRYDAMGNRLSVWSRQGEETAVYDERGRLQCYHRSGGERTYRYDEAGNGVLETAGGQNTTEQERGAGEQACGAGEQGGGVPAQSAGFCLTDYLGSPLRLMDEAGEEQARYAYDEFGRTLCGAEEEHRLPYGFAGYQRRTDGSYQAGCRIYDPVIGRFLSPDPVTGRADRPQTLNAYSYVCNNPLTCVDRTGGYGTSAVDYAGLLLHPDEESPQAVPAPTGGSSRYPESIRESPLLLLHAMEGGFEHKCCHPPVDVKQAYLSGIAAESETAGDVLYCTTLINEEYSTWATEYYQSKQEGMTAGAFLKEEVEEFIWQTKSGVAGAVNETAVTSYLFLAGGAYLTADIVNSFGGRMDINKIKFNAELQAERLGEKITSAIMGEESPDEDLYLAGKIAADVGGIGKGVSIAGSGAGKTLAGILLLVTPNGQVIDVTVSVAGVGEMALGSKVIFESGGRLIDNVYEAVGNKGGSKTQYKKPVSGKSAKEAAKDVPSWAKGNKPYTNENGNDFATRLLDEKYGKGNYPKGAGTEYNKIRKWGDRGFE